MVVLGLSTLDLPEIRQISLPINLPYLATSTLNALEEFLQIFAQDQRPYSLLLRPRSISGRLEDLGHVQIQDHPTTPKHLELSRLLSIDSCGVLNTPSFYSNSFAKLERDISPASKAPYQSASIIN
ncbi:hypothetical protein YC2023_072152 [Brassica napus]